MGELVGDEVRPLTISIEDGIDLDLEAELTAPGSPEAAGLLRRYLAVADVISVTPIDMRGGFNEVLTLRVVLRHREGAGPV